MIINSKSLVTAFMASLAISSFTALIQPANAGLFLSPMYLKMESKQGQSKGVLQVGNTSPNPIRVRLSITGFTYDRNGEFQRQSSQEQVNKNKNNLVNDLTPYLRYSPKEMVIPGNSSRRVRLISLLPPSLPEGEYRTAIFAETLQETNNSQGHKVAFNISIGSALYVAKGKTNTDITVRETNYDANDKKIKILVANQGNGTAKGNINWTLKQKGKIVAAGESGASFLPDTQTNIILNRDRHKKMDLSPGSYQLEGEIIWERSDKQKTSSFNFNLDI